MTHSTTTIVDRDIAEIIAAPVGWDRFARATILVTGAGGMLPAYAVRTLLALNDARGTGITVIVLVRDAARARHAFGGLLDRRDVVVCEQDVIAPVEWDGPVDYVVHGASPARPALHRADPVGTLRANLAGTFNLLDLCVAKASRGFVLMSSAEVYGAQPAGTELIDEDSYGGFDILNPRACYSEGKRASETLCAAYHAQHGLDCRIARFGHVYGPGMSLTDGRVQADFARAVLRGHDIELNSDGSAVRTYTYLADAVAGMFHALLAGTEPAYNVADPRGRVSIRELAQLFAAARPEKGLRVRFTHPDDERSYNPMPGQALDSSRLTTLGWRAHVDLPTGIDRWLSSEEESADQGS